MKVLGIVKCISKYLCIKIYYLSVWVVITECRFTTQMPL